jgi:Lrp/AsnC family leucine-responsive transcriptional regulator
MVHGTRLPGLFYLRQSRTKAEQTIILEIEGRIPNMPSGKNFRVLDEVNQRLLRELHAEPRLTMSALGRRVGMSAPAVTERVQRMESSGVIVGFRMDVDPAALGLPVAAFVRVRPGPGQLHRIVKLAESLPLVSECHRITGEDCFLVKVHAPGIEELEIVLDQFLVHGQTVTSIVVTTPVPPRALPVEGAGPSGPS